MRVLVVQNFDDEGLGQLGAAFDEAKAEVDIRRPYKDDELPSGDGYDALVVLGGPQNARDDAGSPYFPRLLEIMRAFGDDGRSVLGICLGSQLLARAYGADNMIGGASEFGWCKVARTGEGAVDAVLAAAPDSFPIFQWHEDTFTLPPAAIRLAGSDVAANQAFRVGRAAYGIQFHFEADQAHVRRWNEVFAESLKANQPGWLEGYDEQAARHGLLADATGQAIARAWVATIAVGSKAQAAA